MKPPHLWEYRWTCVVSLCSSSTLPSSQFNTNCAANGRHRNYRVWGLGILCPITRDEFLMLSLKVIVHLSHLVGLASPQMSTSTALRGHAAGRRGWCTCCQRVHQSCCLLLTHPINWYHISISGSVSTSTRLAICCPMYVHTYMVWCSGAHVFNLTQAGFNLLGWGFPSKRGLFSVAF